jgi:uncharacterized damage-inducible protein DinB
MTEIERIEDELRRGHDRGAWHGPAVREGLDGITASAAASHPIPGAHSIWELVLHLAAWRGEVMRRLEGGEPGMPPEGDWPPVADTSEAAWAEARRRLEDSHRRLAEAVARFAEDKLDQPVGRKPPDPALGNVGTYYVMLHGIAQHDAYHMGQVAILRKVVQQ